MGVRSMLHNLMRPATQRSATAPSLFHERHLARKLIIRSMGLVAIASVVGAATAADNSVQQAQTTAPTSAGNSTTIDLSANDAQADTAPSNQGSTVSNQTTSKSSSTSTTSGNNSDVSYDITVNGQPIDVPQNGSTSQVITTPDATTTINVTANTSHNGSSFSSTSSTNTSSGFTSDFTHSTVIDQKSGGP